MTMRMALPNDSLTRQPNPYSGTALWRQWGWPACATLLVHGLALATLAVNWAPVAPAPAHAADSVSLTLMSMPLPPPPPPPLPEPVVEPPQPATVSKPAPEPLVDQAAIARERRAREQERERLKERDRQQQALEREQQAERERERAREEQRRQQERQHQLALAAKAEQARLAAEQANRVQQQISQYQPVSKVAPDYPRRALDRSIEGDCTVQYDVTPNGRVSQPSIVSCDDPIFERPSLRAAAAFRYEPLRVNGEATRVPGVRNTFRYRIE